MQSAGRFELGPSDSQRVFESLALREPRQFPPLRFQGCEGSALVSLESRAGLIVRRGEGLQDRLEARRDSRAATLSRGAKADTLG